MVQYGLKYWVAMTGTVLAIIAIEWKVRLKSGWQRTLLGAAACPSAECAYAPCPSAKCAYAPRVCTWHAPTALRHCWTPACCRASQMARDR